MKISYCLPTKNNLRYLKGAIQSIKDNSQLPYEIIVYIDANNDNTEEWLKSNAPEVKYTKNTSNEYKGIAYGYNRCIEQSTSDIVCMFHADMYMGKGFDVNLVKYLKPNTVVAATRIEPPLHPAGKEKVVENFGMYPEDFKKSEFDSYVKKMTIDYQGITSRGIFAPWMTYKNNLTSIGMHDEKLHSYYEDSDIFQRMILNGCEMIQSWDALVYHFTCRGGQFQDGVEKKTEDPKFHIMRNRSARYYMRKWQSWIQNDQYQHPIMPKKLNIGFVMTDVIDENYLYHVEPFATHVYIDNWVLAERYITKEKSHSNIDLRTRIFNHGYIEQNNNNMLLYFSQKDFVANNPMENMGIIQNLGNIISDGYEPDSEMMLGIFKLKTFGDLKDNTSSLINL
jgi:glycosyltransferase involved in cell wall biosynthesis